MQNLFSYGTLQKEKVQIETFQRVLEGSPDELVGYQIGKTKILDPQVVALSGTDIHPILEYTGHEKNIVKGMVFEITNEELLKADSYEVEQYERVSAKLKSGKTTWIYASVESD